MKTLIYGSSGEDVIKLQGGLAILQYKPFTDNPEEVDGRFGIKTLNTVKQFQADAGLKIDGIVGSNTWGKLNDAVVGKINIKPYSSTITSAILSYPDGSGTLTVSTSFGQSVIKFLNTPIYSGIRVGHIAMASILGLLVTGIMSRKK